MEDKNTITNLFTDQGVAQKFKHKRWVIIHPDDLDYTSTIRYSCKTVKDKLVNYNEGYFIVDATVAATAIAAGGAMKNSNAMIKKMIVRINNAEIENMNDVFLWSEIQNLLEFSQDHSRTARQYGWAQDHKETVADNTGAAFRSKLITMGTNTFPVKVKVPLKYMSSFFRALDFPVQNNLFEFDIDFRLKDSVLIAAAAGLTVTITKTELHLPIVELPGSMEDKYVKAIKSGFSKTLHWDRFTLRTETTALTADNQASILIESSINKAKKLYVVPKVPTAGTTLFDPTHVDLFTTTKLKGLNIVIDSEDYFPQDIVNDIEAYEQLVELTDQYNGTLLDYGVFLEQNSIYCFDLSRQKVFEETPNKGQSIRIRCTPSAACYLKFFIGQEKVTTIDFKDPTKTKTV